MPAPCSSLIYVPVGPGTRFEFLLDTLRSIERFADPRHRLLLVDDSAEGLGARAKEAMPEIDLLVLREAGCDATYDVDGGLFVNVARTVRYATTAYSFQVLMRIDTDALMCNPGADTRAIELLDSNPRLGMIGSFRTRCDGHDRAADFPAIGKLVRRNECSPDEELASLMRSLLSEAVANGYEYGEHVIAPGSIMSRAACEALCAHPLYEDPRFGKASLSDDHLHSIFLRAVGLESADFACDDLPLGVWWWHIQWSPEELVRRGKSVVHSVRGYGDCDENAVRAEFRRLAALSTDANFDSRV
ncbi:MAG TPA: hypothetical protein VGJ82_05115 [Thermoanaerobaculia bacterium]|jgi:hypothetical protein